MKKRAVEIKRKTKETGIVLKLNPDGSGNCQISTGLAFFDHMLHQFAFHGGFDLTLKAKGDLEIDPHHLMEDIGLVLGEVINKIMKKAKNIVRYGKAIVPMEEVLVLVAIDLSGRPYLKLDLPYKLPARLKIKVHHVDVGLFKDFFQSVVNKGSFNLHFHFFQSGDPHHLLEASFKAFGLALKEALNLKKSSKISSTKGLLV